MRRWRWCLVILAGMASCAAKTAPPAPKEPLYPNLPLQQVPNFMRGTLYEQVRFTGLEELPVYGYGLVVNLDNTGDSRAPSAVRDYIERQLNIRGFGSSMMGTYQNLTPEEILKDKRVAIVVVEGRIPVGARMGQSFDVIVRAMERNNTKSLAHGDLYETDLSDVGLMEPQSIGVRQQAYAPGGPVFVNPAYAMSEGASTRPGSAASLRRGTVLNGGVCRFDRPINMQIRRPQASTARLIEQVITDRWESPTQMAGWLHNNEDAVVVKAENEGLVEAFVPPQYKGNWKHFLGVVSHLYLNQSAEFQARKARELVALAEGPGAPLADISLCWEAMGDEQLPVFEPLIADANPDVAFAAARAAAFLGSGPARQALVRMAVDPAQHNQLDAVRILGELPDSPEVDSAIAELLDSDRADVRIEAYRLLAANSDLRSGSKENEDSGVWRHYGVLSYDVNHRFMLDIVPSAGPPMIYAASTGVPRIAVIGHQLSLRTPLTFTAMDARLSITSSDGTKLLTMFYRDPLARDPAKAQTHNDLPEILARLGGEGPADAQQRFNFSFGDVVAIAQQLVSQHNVYGTSVADNGQRECLFELEHPSVEADDWTSIPSENREGRPQGDGSVLAGQGN